MEYRMSEERLAGEDASPSVRGVAAIRSRPLRRQEAEGARAALSRPGFSYQKFGRVINTPKLYVLYVGDWSSVANQQRATRLSQFMSDLLASQFMNVLSQYGCGTSGAVSGSVVVTSPSNDISVADIQVILQSAIDAGTIPDPVDQSACFMLVLDDNIAVNDSSVKMCEASGDTAFGFHYFFRTSGFQRCAYSVVPGLTNSCLGSSCPPGTGCSLSLSQTQEQRQTQVMSHEIAEMLTNPLPSPSSQAWVDSTNPAQSEIGDICNGNSGTLTVGSNVWTVQNVYSMTDDACIVSAATPLASLLPLHVVASRSTVDFGSVAIGDVRSVPIAIRNESIEKVAPIVFPSPGSDGAFSWFGTDVQLGVNQGTTMEVEFSPAGTGRDSGTATFSAGGETQFIALSGRGVRGNPQ